MGKSSVEAVSAGSDHCNGIDGERSATIALEAAVKIRKSPVFVSHTRWQQSFSLLKFCYKKRANNADSYWTSAVFDLEASHTSSNTGKPSKAVAVKKLL